MLGDGLAGDADPLAGRHQVRRAEEARPVAVVTQQTLRQRAGRALALGACRQTRTASDEKGRLCLSGSRWQSSVTRPMRFDRTHCRCE